MAIFALTNARIIDCTGADPIENGAVVIEGERIKEVLAGAPKALPAGAGTIDCKGRTLLPGLIDAHVHVGCVEPTFTDQQRTNFTSTLVIKTIKIIKESLDQGFTTLRDAGGADPGFGRPLKRG